MNQSLPYYLKVLPSTQPGFLSYQIISRQSVSENNYYVRSPLTRAQVAQSLSFLQFPTKQIGTGQK